MSRRSCLFTAIALLALAACTSDTESGPPATAIPTSAAATTSTLSTVSAVSTVTGVSTIAPTTAPATTTSAPTTTRPATSNVPTTTTATTDPATTDGPQVVGCVVPETAPVVAESVLGPVADGQQEWNITAFDGAVIRAHWFPLPGLADDATAPTVLMGPGWASPGDTDTESGGDLVSIATLHEAGFNVLTWDPRGFGDSTGTVTVGSAAFEGRDVEQLIEWLATRSEVALDADRDPRLGMVGGSYGGGIQLVAAAIDCRIDAIVPIMAWHSLRTSLFKADTLKIGWSTYLTIRSFGSDVDPTMARFYATAANGTADPADVQWLADRGPGERVADITVPTLIIQGTVDTLFTLDEAVTNFEAIAGNGVPAAMLWFCGGHGACLTDAGDTSAAKDAAVAWLEHYVKGDASVAVGATFEFVDQDGVTYIADGFPQPDGQPLTGTGAGSLALVADGGAGPLATDVGGLAALVAPLTPARATNAVNVTIEAGDAPQVIVGAPTLSMTYQGTAPAEPAPDTATPTRVFAQLVDDTTGLVLGNQITPIEVVLDGEPHQVEVPLEMVAFTAHPGTSITLQVVASTVAYAAPRFGGSVDFTSISVSLPVVTAVTAAT